jgi:hypothetical protein
MTHYRDTTGAGDTAGAGGTAGAGALQELGALQEVFPSVKDLNSSVITPVLKTV